MKLRNTLVLLVIIIYTNGLSVNINPIPAVVNAGDNLIVTSTITKTELESWKSFTFYVVVGDTTTVCRGAPNIAPAACSDIFGCSYGFGFFCNYTHFNLQFNNVEMSILGFSIYAEVSIAGSSKVRSFFTTIHVKIPLQRVSLTPNGTITKTESETQVFRCFARSLPIASLSWYLSGSILPTQSPPVTTTDTVTSTYTYTAQKEDHGKRLTCTAVYESNSVTKDALLNVLYRPNVIVSPNINPFRVQENTTNLLLACIVMDANPAVTSYTWKKYDSTISGSANFTIPTVHRSHAGSYKCSATNSVGNSDPSTALQLEILYGVEILTVGKKEPVEGTRLTVTCSGQSYPAMTDNDVTWTKHHNYAFSMKGRLLLIDNVNRLDSGTFVCSVVIKLIPTIGEPINVTGRTSVEVDVLYRPTVTISPKYAQYDVIENTTNLVLDCTVTDANPTATSYRWYKDGSITDNSIGASYTISIVRRSHTGRYTCDATNSVGSSYLSSDVQLNVLYGVNINPIGITKPPEGTQLTINCSGQSYPVMTSSDVKWFKQNNNTFSRVGLQLVIDKVNRLDSGIYVCSVALQLTPTIGQPVNVAGSTTVEVDVLYRPDVIVSPDIHSYRVIENTTNLYVTCKIKDANPAVTSYRWYKDGITVSTAAIYIISTVYRSHTGNYTCDATNVVGSSDLASELHLDVLYGVSLKLSGKEVNVNESERWDLSCIGDGNPLPNMNWIYNNNVTIVGEQKANVTYIAVEHANCVDTGLYMCSGNNSIGEAVSQSADINVACKPRTYNNLDREDIIMRATDESINISTTFISFPLSHISWSRMLSGGHLADLDSNFKYFTIPSHLPYETIAILQKDQLKPNEFGIYLVNASNIYGSFLLKYHFIQKRDPILPSYVYVVCKSTTAIVILKPIVNENLPQDLYIQFAVEGKDMTSIKVHTNDANQPIEYTVTGLNPGRKYNFSILTVNPFGETRSNQFECLTETLSYREDMLAVKEGKGGMFSAGIASLVVGLLFFVAATIFIFRKRFRKTYTKSSKSDEYSDLQTSNPAFQDPYTSLQNPIESRHRQEPSANTYEECGNASDAAAYQNIENTKSGYKKTEKNMGIYDNMKI